MTLTVNGTGFLSTTTVQVGGVADVTSYVSSTQVAATVTTQQLVSGTQLSVIALNGTESSGSGAAVNLQVTNPVPAITALTPATLLLGAVSTVVSVTGTGFVPTTVIDVNGSTRTTIFVSSTQVNVTMTAPDVAATSSLSLTAVNAAPGGGTSAAATIAVNNPKPGGPMTVSPTVVLTGTATPTTVTVTGTNFVPASTVELGGVVVATTYVSSTQLTFQLSVTEEATSQQIPVSVMNPTPGGGSALGAELEILPQSATPVITSVSPSQFLVGSGATSVTVNGTDLFALLSSGQVVLSASVLWNGTALQIQGACVGCGWGSVGGTGSTTIFSNYVTTSAHTLASPASSSPESITFQVPASLLASVGTASITVSSTTATPAVSNALTVTIANPPAPTLTLLSPNSGLTNTAETVALYGTGFTANSTVLLNGSSIATTYESSTELMATIPASSIATPGVVNLAVTTPAPGGGISAPLPFTAYNPPAPTLTSLSPNAGPINTAASLTLYGTGFTVASTVAMNGTNIAATYVGSTELTVTVPASSLTLPGNVNFTVTTPAPGGGTTAPLPFTAYLAIANNDIVYNATNGLLYASVPVSGVGSGGNTVEGIDPVTGTIMRQIWVGSNPRKLALSTDGTQLFVGLDGAGAVAQVDLTKGAVVNQFSLGGGPGVYNPPYTATYLAAVPGEPNSVAVAVNGSYLGGTSVTIYDSGVSRARSSSGVGEGPLSFGSSASILYMANGTTIEQLTVGSTGITAATALVTTSGSVTSIQYDSGQLYLSTGQVFKASTGALLGTFYSSASTAATGPIVSDSTLGRAFVGTTSYSSSGQVLAFNESTFNSIGSIPVNGIGAQGYPTNFQKIVRWGQNGLALSAAASAFTSVNQIFIFQLPLVKDLSASPADVSVTLSRPTTASVGNNIEYTAGIANLGPSSAQGVTVSFTLAPSLIVNSATASQGTCGSGSVFTCDLGSLANGASATVTVSATPTTPGTIESTATANSVSFDPALTNNQATITTTVTGNATFAATPSISSISPNFVQAGSPDFTLTVTGAGFNEASTVNLGAAALTTTYVNATQLTAAVTASEIANYGWAAVTVTNSAPGGGVSQVLPLTIYELVNVPASGLLFDPYAQQLYATVPSSATTMTGNSVVTINPFTAAVGTPVNVGSEPTVMTETSDGNFLYIGLSGSASLAQFDPVHQKMLQTLSLSSASSHVGSNPVATSLSVMPGTDTTLAVGFSGTDGILDISGSSGTFRSNFAGDSFPQFGDASHLYTYDNYSTGAEFYRYSINASGATQIDGTTLDGMGGFSGSFQAANGLVYGAGGGIINPATTPPSQVATLPLFDFYDSGIEGYSVAVAVDPSLQKEFLMMENTAGTWAYGLARYDLTTYTPEALIDMPASASSVEAGWTMLRFGQDGLALLSSAEDYSTNQPVIVVMLVRGPFVTPQLLVTNTAASLTASSATSIAHGEGNTLLTLTGANFVPGMAVTWNGSYRTTMIVDATHVTVAIPASDLTSAGSGSLVATNPGAPASNLLTVTIN
jgi:hypothetical protein